MHRILKDDREYERVNGQWRRVKQSPEPAKPCRVNYRGIPCWYAEKLKMLFVHGDRESTVFPSKSAAQKAVWWTVQNTGIPGSHEDYDVEVI